MALIFDTNKHTIKQVKNLNWLLRHQSKVLEIFASDTPARDNSCWFAARLNTGQVYFTKWASINVMFGWVNSRQCLKGLEIHWQFFTPPEKQEFLTEIVGQWVKDCPLLFN